MEQVLLFRRMFGSDDEKHPARGGRAVLTAMGLDVRDLYDDVC